MRISELVNPNIVKPDFRAEKEIDTSIGKLRLVAKNTATGNVPQFVISVINNEGKSIGHFRFVVVDYRPEKKLFGFKLKSKTDPYVVGGNVSVWNEYQRKGIATQVYKFVRELGNEIRPSTSQTAAGKAFWDSGAANK